MRNRKARAENVYGTKGVIRAYRNEVKVVFRVSCVGCSLDLEHTGYQRLSEIGPLLTAPLSIPFESYGWKYVVKHDGYVCSNCSAGTK